MDVNEDDFVDKDKSYDEHESIAGGDDVNASYDKRYVDV